MLPAITGFLAVTWGANAVLRAQLGPGSSEPTLAEVRSATDRFRDVKMALAAAAMMGRSASLGAMGVHYFRPDLLGITVPPSPRVDGVGTHTDFRRPSILIYEPQDDGSLALVAVENRDNPNGVFAPFNPAVTCAHHRGARAHSAAHSAQ